MEYPSFIDIKAFFTNTATSKDESFLFGGIFKIEEVYDDYDYAMI